MTFALAETPAAARSPSTWRLGLWLALTIAFCVFGARLTRNAEAIPATNWMRMYTTEQFATTGELVSFLRSLRVPIPPVISGLEILSMQYTGAPDMVTKDLYRVGLVGAYVLALWFSYPSLLRLCLSSVLVVVFLWSTVLIHPMNPQSYDILLPFFLLLFLTALRLIRAQPENRSLGALLLSAVAGFSLTMAELARPYVLLFLPVLLTGAFLVLRQHHRRAMVAFLLPIIAFTGTWHVHLYATHGQLISTNYSGFNLRRAWPQAPLPPGMWETRTDVADQQVWPNINTEAHHLASRALQRTVLAYVVSEPVGALDHALDRIMAFVRPHPELHEPGRYEGAIVSIYELAAPAAVALVVVNGVILALFAMRKGKLCYALLGSADNLLLIVASLSLLVLSLGEAGEENRLLLSVLPLLAAAAPALPGVRHA